MSITYDYYEKNADAFIEGTINCDMTTQYQFFEKYLKKNDTVLDLGFGSGRDSLYFMKKYRVYSVDPVKEFCDKAKVLGIENIYQAAAEDLNFENKFDGIWACASLLHVKSKDLNKVFKNCSKALKDEGIMYCSFKYGNFEGIMKNREFLFLTEATIKKYLDNTNLDIIETLITTDVREGRSDEKWLNCIFKKKN